MEHAKNENAWRLCLLTIVWMLTLWCFALVVMAHNELTEERQARPANLSIAQPGEFAA